MRNPVEGNEMVQLEEQKAFWQHEGYLKTHHIKYTTNLKWHPKP